MITNDARCTREIKSGISIAKATIKNKDKTKKKKKKIMMMTLFF
jgi:hypothetical protein